MEDIIKIFGGSLIAGLIITGLIHLYKKHGFSIVNIVKNTFGALFLFSATVKAIDPSGTAYKMGEYFEEFNMGFMEPLQQTFSVSMIVLELLLGLALILGWRKKLTLWLLILMNVFFTFLTGFTTFTGKVTDCGCFGDFIKQTPKESFIKDLILVALLLVIWLGKDKIKEVFSDKKSTIILAIVGLGFLFFNFSNFYFDKPNVDFRPYKVGKDINAQRVEVADKLEYGFIFENTKSGDTKRIAMNEYSTYSSNPDWKFKDQDNKVIEKGIPAIISNFAAFDRNGEDQTDNILLNEDYSFIVLSKHTDESNMSAWEDVSKVEIFAHDNNLQMYAFTATPFAETDRFKEQNDLNFPFYEADETFIKTVVRANPGLMLIKNGIVVGKWHHKHIPSAEELSTLMK